MSDQPTITREIRNHLFLIGLDRADKRNAFNLQMLRELSEAYTEYEENKELWCAVVFAHGEHFTAGLDLAEVGPAVASGNNLFPEGAVDPLGVIGRVRTKPVVCAVQGYCYTIGMEMVLASDICVAGRDVKLSQLEVRRGIMPFGGATLRLPRVAGWGNAMLHLLTGDVFDAEEAYRIGLAQFVVEPGKQLEKAIEIAGQIAAQAPLAVQAAMASAWYAVGMHESEEVVKDMISKASGLMHTEDAVEGMMSFIERRDANFKGK